MADMMPKLSSLRDRLAETNPECLLEVDGGIDTVTAPIVWRRLSRAVFRAAGSFA